MKAYAGCMTNLAKVLLAGAALSVLAAASACAQAPDIHFAAIAPHIKLRSGSPYHYKTNIRDPSNSTGTFTSTIDFSGTFTETQLYHKWVELWAEGWSQGACKKETVKNRKRTGAGKIKLITTTSSAEINYELFYKLENKRATQDSFRVQFKGHDCSGYNLNLLTNTHLTINH